MIKIGNMICNNILNTIINGDFKGGDTGNIIVGKGNVIPEKYKHSGITEIDSSSIFNITVTFNENEGNYYIVETNENILQYLDIQLQGTKIICNIKSNISMHCKNLNIKINNSSYNGLSLVKISGLSNIIIINSNSKGLDVQASGNSYIKIDGNAQNLSAVLDGNSSLIGTKFEADNTLIDISGCANAQLNNIGNFNINASGISNVSFSKKPEHCLKNISGMAKIVFKC